MEWWNREVGGKGAELRHKSRGRQAKRRRAAARGRRCGRQTYGARLGAAGRPAEQECAGVNASGAPRPRLPSAFRRSIHIETGRRGGYLAGRRPPTDRTETPTQRTSKPAAGSRWVERVEKHPPRNPFPCRRNVQRPWERERRRASTRRTFGRTESSRSESRERWGTVESDE